jgi:trans-2,3-dihydro-3-hydroxyanthranilate isomerase
VLWESGLSDGERRQVPKLLGTSHAVFVERLDDQPDQPRAALRFFTKSSELPACGHGTVAALAFLAEHATPERTEYQVTLLASGRSFAGSARRERDHMFAAFDPGEVELREPTAHERSLALDVLGQRPEILELEICVASIGRPRLLVPIASRSALAGLTPDYDRLRDGCDRLGLLGCYVHSVPAEDGRLAARMFAPSIGVPEDIANANSTACLAAKIAREGVSRITVDMGDSLDQPATITATAKAKATGGGIQIRVGGAAELTGTLRLAVLPPS